MNITAVRAAVDYTFERRSVMCLAQRFVLYATSVVGLCCVATVGIHAPVSIPVVWTGEGWVQGQGQ